MKISTKKLLIIIWIALATFSFGLFVLSQAKANGHTFTLNFPGTKLFDVLNAAPGDITTKTFSITNSENQSKPIYIYGRGSGEGKLNNVLGVEITGGNTFNIPMNTFLALSDQESAENLLDTLGPNETKNYNFTISFDQNADNEYQGLASTFDVTFGVVGGQVLSENTTSEPGSVLSAITTLPNTGNPIIDKLILAFISLIGLGLLIRLSLYFSRKLEDK